MTQDEEHLLLSIVTGVQCIFVPFGTVLGVFTIVVLSRLSVKALFQSEGAP